MGPRLNNDTTLTTGEVETIFESRFVRTDLDGSRFIQVTPYLIQATAVPEPGAGRMYVASISVEMGGCSVDRALQSEGTRLGWHCGINDLSAVPTCGGMAGVF